ncbi:DUF2567 domain-containing protein [Mycobacterium sp. THU-M116]
MNGPGRVFAGAALALSLTGALLGALWAWIAAPIHAVAAKTRAGERVHEYLGTESEHFFDDPCLLLGLLTALAVVTAVLGWQWRRRRGPGMVVGLFVGMLATAAVACAVGAVLVRLRYGEMDFDAIPLSGSPAVAYVVEAPPVFFSHGPLQVAATLLWPAAIATLVYALMAAAHTRDDLGASPAAHRPADPLPVGAGGSTDTAVS